MPIDPSLREAEKQELETVLKSRLFSRSHSMCGLLDYVCRKYFDGRVDQIKEYTIAVEHFGRSEEFQSKRDPIVRVDANRLRQRLRRYYRTEGKDHPVYISIPSGQYAPVFHHRSLGDPIPPDEDQLDVISDELLDEELEKPPLSDSNGGSDGIGTAAPPALPVRRSWIRVLALGVAVIVTIGALSYWFTSRIKTGVSRPAASDGAPTAAALARPSGPEIRILAGSTVESSIDERGKVWEADRFFSGGARYDPLPTARLKAQNSVLCRTARVGTFRYDVPLQPGVYELRLYFAELRYGVEPEDGGEATRRFDVKANGQAILTDFDIISDMGGDIGVLDVKVFKDIRPADDGFLHLSFEPRANEAILTGLEILPGIPGKIRPVRISTGNTAYISSDKVVWEPDFFYRGGRQVSRIHAVTGTADSAIYRNERFGYFTYRIPVVPGRYTVNLKFAETYFGQKNFRESAFGLRRFNLQCNGVTLLKNFDIAREAGGEGRALDKIFHGIQSDPQDKIVLTFVPVANYACVNAIEVIQE